MMSKLRIVLVGMIVMMMVLSTSVLAVQKSAAVDVYYVPMNFKFDSKQFAPPEGQRGFIYEGSTYVPIRFVSYSLGKAVKWDGDSYTVTVEEPSKTDLISIKEYNLNTELRNQQLTKLDTSKLTPSKINVYKEAVTYIFDGQAKAPSMDLPGLIIDGSLYVPMRFFSESVGQKIDWDPETYTVSAVVKAEGSIVPEDPTKEEQKPPVVIPSGGGGGGAVKPSYESLTAAAESQLNTLKSSCTSQLNSIADQFIASRDLSLIAQGQSILNGCDISFEQILTALNTQLTANGYSTAILQTYRDAYQQTKTDAMNSLLRRL